MGCNSEAVDHWPADRIEIPASLIESSDGRMRIRFWARSDGMVQFEKRRLEYKQDQGQRYAIWIPCYPPSGIFPDIAAAQVAARQALESGMD